jgi:hypothetical protein
MSSRQPLVFKFASEDWEFEHIHRLNYKTFVEEIPQHKPSPAHRIVDKFHAENTYLICLAGRKLAGMLAVRGNRPFSLDQKLERLDSFLPAGRKICEIRLLAVEKKFRGAQVLQGILALLWQHGIEKGYDLAIISGTTRQFKLYQHLGFVPFGPTVGVGDAQFQPMYVTLETFEATAREFLRSSPSRSFQPSAVNFLPGPVAVRREVRRAFEQAAESHRAGAFLKDFGATKEVLCDLVRAGNVQLLVGSGTLANDVVGAQLSLENNRGVVLSNGEFGSRLIDHARRFQLDFEALEFPSAPPADGSGALTVRPRPASSMISCSSKRFAVNSESSSASIASARSVRFRRTWPVCSWPRVPAARGSGPIRGFPWCSILMKSPRNPGVSRAIWIWVSTPSSRACRSRSPRTCFMRFMPRSGTWIGTGVSRRWRNCPPSSGPNWPDSDSTWQVRKPKPRPP